MPRFGGAPASQCCRWPAVCYDLGEVSSGDRLVCAQWRQSQPYQHQRTLRVAPNRLAGSAAEGWNPGGCRLHRYATVSARYHPLRRTTPAGLKWLSGRAGDVGPVLLRAPGKVVPPRVAAALFAHRLCAYCTRNHMIEYRKSGRKTFHGCFAIEFARGNEYATLSESPD